MAKRLRKSATNHTCYTVPEIREISTAVISSPPRTKERERAKEKYRQMLKKIHDRKCSGCEAHLLAATNAHCMTY
jgi:hypothetical protein